MNAPSMDIKDILVAEPSLNLIFGGPDGQLYVGKEPETPINTVTIFDTGGLTPQLTMDKDEIYQYPSINIRVRNKDYETGFDLANNIKDALHGRSHETWNAAIYELIQATGEAFMLGWDDNNNAWFIINFNIQRKPA